MKKVLTVLPVIAALLSGCAMPQTKMHNTQIEPNALISDDLKGNQRVANEAAAVIRAHGYSCNSISVLTTHWFSRGFDVSCNNSTYTYEVYDEGGNWRAKVK